jgi:hypothetical protein
MVQSIASSLSNSGPPKFKETLPSILAPLNNKTYYNLPEISDPDGDAWTVDVSLGEAITFASF